jgi:DNA-binding GntR family transcriptional regulator
MQMLKRAREVRRTPLNDELQAIVENLRTRDPNAARAAIQTHLGGLIEKLLVTAQLEEMEQTRAPGGEARRNRAASTTR